MGIVQTNIKTFPVRDSCQLPIMTALLLRAKVAPSDVASLKIETTSLPGRARSRTVSFGSRRRARLPTTPCCSR